MMSRWSRWAWVALVAACQSGPEEGGSAPNPQLSDAGLEDTARAEAWLESEAPLPSRAEVVAVTDRLSIAAEDAEEEEQAKLTWLSARLRERVWRLDRSRTDAREAIEQYGRLVKMEGEHRCEADLRRARLAGELERDGGATYRAAYLALERQTSDSEPDDACTRSLRRMLVHAEAYRPTGEAWIALQREGRAQRGGEASSGPEAPEAQPEEPLPPPPEGADEVVVAPSESMVEGGAKLVEVTPYSFPEGGRVVVHLDGPVRYETGMVAPDPDTGRGHRVYVDLLDARIDGVDKDIEATGLVERVRLGERKNGIRVVLDLAKEAHRRIFYLPDPFRVVVDVTPPTGASEEETDADGRTVRRVTLDPGHGGWDAGAVGPTGLREKDVALDIAHRAAPALASELGVETMLTRDKDVFVELEERTARANAFQSDLFVSVHCNATEDGHASGFEVFILDPTREADRSALRLVARENHARTGGVMDPGKLDAQVTHIARGLTLESTTRAARSFASLLTTSTEASLGPRYPGIAGNGVKTAGFFVLVGAHMPAVLYETSFISNPDDESKLATADYRQKLADAIVNAVRAYAEGRSSP